MGDTERMSTAEFQNVPAADPDAVVDPHWADLRSNSPLPPTYMPPAMSGAHSTKLRVIAIGLIVMFVGATAVGVCLTYGPQVWPF